MDRTEFESVPFAGAAEADELSWEDERGRLPAAPRGRPAPQRGKAAPQRGRPSPQNGQPTAQRKRPAPPQPGRRPPPRPVPPFGGSAHRLPFGSLGLSSFTAAPPCVCPAHGTEFIRWVQSSLNQVEGAALPIDGVMGAATRAALRRFQSTKGLPVDGIAGPEVEQALRDARRGEAPAGGGAGGGAGADAAAPESGEVAEFETLQFESPASRPTLRQGSRGSAVTDLQRRLAAAGFSPGAADGIFGSQTAAAVRSFQRARGLVADGIVGPLTWGALLGATPGWPSGPSTPSTPSTPGGGTASGVWVLPPSVRAAGDAQTVRYDSPPSWAGDPGNCTGTFTDGAATLKAYLQANFPGISGIYGYSCRPNSATPSETSVHGTGRALDIMIPMVGGRANSAVGDPIANWLVTNASALGVQYLIWNRVRWSGGRTPRVAPYTGPVPHTDHVHMELNQDGANRRTAWYRDHELADEGADGLADAAGFEFEDGLGATPSGALLSCGPAPGTAAPDPGSCAPGIGDASCTQGVWYRPTRGDSLWTVARRTIRHSGQTRVRVLDYARQISRHRHNAQYLSRSGSGLATRQFLNLWGGPEGKSPVGPGGGYGLMFLPPFGPGQERASCPRP